MKTKDQFSASPATTVTEGHDYLPNWINVPFFVDHISGGIVYGEFYTGHRRQFTKQHFLDSFTHHKSCILCSSRPKKDKTK